MFSKEFINNFSTLGLKLLDWANEVSFEPLSESAIRESEEFNAFFTPSMQSTSCVTVATYFLDTALL